MDPTGSTQVSVQIMDPTGSTQVSVPHQTAKLRDTVSLSETLLGTRDRLSLGKHVRADADVLGRPFRQFLPGGGFRLLVHCACKRALDALNRILADAGVHVHFLRL
jgi:hypothetical protein